MQSNNVPTYVLPRHVTLTTSTPPSVSCHTIPSSVTDVPGSHGPRQSGSVIVPTDVPTQMSTISFGSTLTFFEGGGLQLPFSSLQDVTDDDEFDEDVDKIDDEVDDIADVVDNIKLDAVF